MSLKKTLMCQIKITIMMYFFMPQMSPCNWMFMFLFINLMITLIKLNIFFEKK